MPQNEEEQALNIVGPLKEITVRIGIDQETGPFVYVEGVVIEPPTVIGGEPKTTPIPDLICFAELANVCSQVFAMQHQARESKEKGPRIELARGPHHLQ